MIYLCAALLGAILPTGDAQTSGVPSRQVLLLKGPIHYDFALPLTADTRQTFAAIAKHHPELGNPAAKWLLVGWGATAFYTSVGSYRDVNTRAIWRGLTGDTSVMRVDVLGTLPDDLPLHRLGLSGAQYTRLLNAIEDSFANTTPLDHNGFTPTDAFYPAKGRFNIFQTCNVWIGKMIRASGTRFGAWTPLPLSVSLSHRLYAPN